MVRKRSIGVDPRTRSGDPESAHRVGQRLQSLRFQLYEDVRQRLSALLRHHRTGEHSDGVFLGERGLDACGEGYESRKSLRIVRPAARLAASARVIVAPRTFG